ncbi:juvenile hormone esterase-like [Penaeus indicus]|uniref:juvenile hormone esterase-like n=1 Tax=Penaeus indicus TaxID=29960 RepID=UPI00300DABA7
MRLVFAIAALFLSAAAAPDEAPMSMEETVEVELQQGAIVGSRSEAEEGRFFYSFKSIPFAQPPVGELRFKDPIPGAAWEGTRNGSVPMPMCPQVFGPVVYGQEDCLYLSVYTPRPYTSDLPVMVWIFSGAFSMGFGEQYQPLPFLTMDVVLVVIQYRLSTLGFLSTEDSELPGNLGLKDQALALRWVQDNIRDLGGDPDKVTIFGHNAGGVSVHYHMLSPMSKGLFRRAIMQSGVALCPWAVREDHREVAIEIGRQFSCPGVSANSSEVDSAALVACLRKVPAGDLVSAERKFATWFNFPYVMVPRVDGDFLPAHPAVLVREGRYNRVDVMAGTTRDEGALVTRMVLHEPPAMGNLMQNFTQNGHLVLGLEAWDDDPEYLARLAFHRYLGPLEFDLGKVDAFSRLAGDGAFNMAVRETLQHHARDTVFGYRVFAYELQYRGEHSYGDFFLGPPPEWNSQYVVHGDDLQYMFSSIMMNITLSKPEDLFVSRIMLNLWANFAATGHPTPDMSLGFKWTPMTASSQSFLAITSAPTMKTFDRDQDLKFWTNLPTKINKLLYPERFSMPDN